MSEFMDFVSGDLLANIIALGSVSIPLFAFLIYRLRKTIAKDNVLVIGSHFREIVDQISAGSGESKIAAAIQLRRFLSRNTEFGVNKMPYAKDCLEVMSAFLRVMPTSNLQKILADNLRYVPNEFLIKADLQRVNLSKAYISDSNKAISLAGADFFQANLSGASFKGANLEDAQFYEATLSGTTLRNVNLRNANFNSSALCDVDLRNCNLEGANFTEAKIFNVDFTSALNLDKAIFKGCTGCGNRFPEGFDVDVIKPVSKLNDGKKVFLSKPGVMDLKQKNIFNSVRSELIENGLEVVELERGDYESSNVMEKLNNFIKDCDGILVFGFCTILIKDGEYRLGTDDHRRIDSAFIATPWNQIEAGIAIAHGKQTLLMHDSEISDGLFDPMVQDALIQRVELSSDLNGASKSLSKWIQFINSH